MITNPLAPSEPTAASLHAQAETCLRAIAGADSLLKPEQWEAISALVAERRRALVVQRTGFGKSAVYFVSTSLLPRTRCRPDGDRLTLALAHA